MYLVVLRKVILPLSLSPSLIDTIENTKKKKKKTTRDFGGEEEESGFRPLESLRAELKEN